MTGILIREAKGGEKEEKAVRRGKQISQGVLVPPVATRSQERPEQILPGLQEEPTLPHLDLGLLASRPLLLLSPQARRTQLHPFLLILLICLLP